jgi:protein-S-isoprenylcysteine O-methyltransferase
MITTLTAYLLVVIFFILEGRVRQGQAAKSFAAGEHDRGSTRRIGTAFGLSILLLLLAPLLNFLKLGGVIPPGLAWAGVVLAAGGLGLRLWAPLVLGRFYTRTLRTADQQTVVDEGPYRLIRHPGYAGVLALWVGAALATTNLPVTLAVAVLMFAAYAYRIRVEEAMLVTTLGQAYVDYQGHTKRLIPFVY